ncbi:MAG: Flp pilus assembly complex ATPase component TadA [Candidatus Riflebacteria bacterium]|nr:Flp pilus assembly complex ATPase component TadA [Candidatus Riflebacteria bacterium]
MPSMNPAVARVREALKGKDPDVIKRSLAALESEATAAEAGDVLTEALGSAFWPVRRLAANLLIELGDVVVPRLSLLIDAGTRDQVYWACYALSRLGPPAGPVLRKAVTSTVKEHRLYALHTLARRKEPDSIESLIVALDDPVWSLRKRASDALSTRPERDRIVDALRQELGRGNRNRIYWAVRILAKLLGAKAVPILKKLVAFKDDDLRYLAVTALGRIPAEEVPPLLVDYLKDRSTVVREKALELLVGRGSQVRAPLVALLDAPDTTAEARYWGLRALKTVSFPDFIARARGLMATDDQEQRHACIRALSEASSQEAAELLIGCFKNPSWVMRKLCAEHVSAMGERAVEPLHKAATGTDEDQQYWAIVALARIGSPAMSSLRELVMSGDPSIRSLAMSALAEGDRPEEAVTLLKECLKDEHWPVRRQAAECIRTLGIKVAPFILEAATSPEGNVRFWSKKVLKELMGDDAVRFADQAIHLTEELKSRLFLGIKELPVEELKRVVVLEPEEAITRLKLQRPGLTVPERPRPPASAGTLPVVGPNPSDYLVSLVQLLTSTGGLEAHLRAGIPPMVRSGGSLARLETSPLTRAELERIAAFFSGPGAGVAGRLPLSIGYDLERAGRLKVQLFQEARGLAVSVRPLGFYAPRMRDVGEDELLDPLVSAGSGLVVISGLSCSGRTWTASALLDAINQERPVHIATVEAPVEHLHQPRQALISQIGIPMDAANHLEGLKIALSADARVIMVSDASGSETALMALEAAATNTLVILIMRAHSAVQALQRLIDVVEPVQRDRALLLLTNCLKACVHQALLPHVSGKGVCVAREVVSGVPNVLHPLGQGRFAEIAGLVKANPPQGVRPFEEAVRELQRRGVISQIVARTAIKERGVH